ncbi:NblA/ycf18 family protein [Waterburya agarophytonicola K14]|uniref:NblA/ycf18 family protein n=1 Tax=Waterburya agarophytonicola KI4 TaxID=2874699 RepID=A0A964FFT0_9CYAN|nr:NblA/ycf18 family protein [Waterburya agarophytonicola]MCC0175783.1 NblA/ycf18 family protein [Waterburya agarophytonicola KI4]
MDRLENSLSMEQELSHRIFGDRVAQLNREEAQELLIQMHQQMLYKDNIYKALILNQEKDIVDMLFGAKKHS